MQKQGRNPIEYVSSLRVICLWSSFPPRQGNICLSYLGRIDLGRIPLVQYTQTEDRSTCSLNSDAEVTTLKWVGQSHASRRNMLSPCEIVFPLEKMNHICCSQVCLPLVIHKETNGSFHSLKVWPRTVAPIITLSLKRSGPPLPLTL